MPVDLPLVATPEDIQSLQIQIDALKNSIDPDKLADLESRLAALEALVQAAKTLLTPPA